MENNIEKLILDSVNSLREDVSELNAQVAVLTNTITISKTNFEDVQKKIATLDDTVKRLRFDVDEFKADLESQKADEKTAIEQVKKESFPNGDMQGHRQFHENEMEKRKGAASIKKDVISHILKGVLWATIVGVFWAVVYTVKSWLFKSGI